MNENNLSKFQSLLRTLFQFDCADLDFGIYRILNYKREQVECFITERLPQIVDQAFARYAAADKAAVDQEIEQKRQEIIKTLGEQAIDESGQLRNYHRTKLGQQYLLLMEKHTQYEVADELKTRIYNDLFTFFSRYYEEGDFISKRRYGRRETYAIPYNGEEVILYWANRDQYYIKTGDRFKVYRFKVDDYSISFELRNAALEQNGNGSKKRYFVLSDEAPIIWNGQEKALTIALEYRPLTEAEEGEHGRTEQQKPQDSLNEAAAKKILELIADGSLKVALAKPEGANGASLLHKHLTRFSRRNTADFFIHKDLRGFLRRELDFFIKNEVLLLDELIAGGEEDLREHVQRGRVVRQVAEAIIEFLAQVEDFQKRLWEKRKFVLRTEYCLTCDRVPEELWDEVLANEAQAAEWRQLYALDDLMKAQPLMNTGLNKEFLKAHPTLMIDTRHFPEDFKWRILAHFDDLDEAQDGLLIKSENWQALNLLLEKYREKVKCIYIDPPYNTGSDEFIYRDNYQHSSWLTMMNNCIMLSRLFTQDGATFTVQISDIEDAKLKSLLDQVFGAEEFVNRITVRTRAPSGFKTVNVGVFESAEYLYLYANNKGKVSYHPQFVETGYDANYKGYVLNIDASPEDWKLAKLSDVVAEKLGYSNSRQATKAMGKDNFVKALGDFALQNSKAVFRYTEIDDVGASKRTVELKSESKKRPNKIFIQKREGYRDRIIQNGEELSFYSNKVQSVDGAETPAVPLTNIWIDVPWEGIANEGLVRLEKGKKPERLLHRIVAMATNPGDYVMDSFFGTGTTCAVSHKGGRRWLGIEMDESLFQMAAIRLKHVLHGEQTGISKVVGWKGGGFFKYQYLEQYEDTLHNLELPRVTEGQKMLELFGDEYLLKYMLDFETQGSASLLNLDMFRDPFAYKLKVQEGDEIVKRPVDLVETFNYLLGIEIKKLMTFNNGGRLYRAVLGQKNGKRTAIVWRSVVGLEDNEKALTKDKAFIEKTVLPALLGEAKPDRLLVNGACFVKDAEPIEPEFHRLMFAPVGV